jgi:hypothetical protein
MLRPSLAHVCDLYFIHACSFCYNRSIEEKGSLLSPIPFYRASIALALKCSECIKWMKCTCGSEGLTITDEESNKTSLQ